MIRPQKAWFSLEYIHNLLMPRGTDESSMLPVIPNDAGVTVQVSAGVLVALALCATTQVHTSFKSLL